MLLLTNALHPIKQSENLRARPIALETGLALQCPVAQHYLVTTRNAAGPTAHPEKRAARLSPLGGPKTLPGRVDALD